MDIKEAIFGRRAVREYTGEAIDRDTIRRLVDAAIHAPSAVNQQPWTDGVDRAPKWCPRSIASPVYSRTARRPKIASLISMAFLFP